LSSQFRLGGMYQAELGVPQDYFQAHMWYTLSGGAGLNEAPEARDAIAGIMTPNKVVEAQRLACAWKPKTQAVVKFTVRGSVRQASAKPILRKVPQSDLSEGDVCSRSKRGSSSSPALAHQVQIWPIDRLVSPCMVMFRCPALLFMRPTRGP
jgi:TPR repeat protein